MPPLDQAKLDRLESHDDRIDVVCDEFESAWRRGGGPRLELYLEAAGNDTQRRALFLELLLVEIECRREHGDVPGVSDYQVRFAEFGEVIAALEFKQQLGAGSTAAPGETLSVAAPGAIGPTNRIAHFELVALVGSGASGIVWKARDTRLARIVAVKTPSLGNSPIIVACMR